MGQLTQVSSDGHVEPELSASGSAGDSTEGDWFVSPRGSPLGPFTAAAVEAMWARGEISDKTFCWKPGFEAWKRLALIPELQAPLESALEALLSLESEYTTPDPTVGGASSEPQGAALFGALVPRAKTLPRTLGAASARGKVSGRVVGASVVAVAVLLSAGVITLRARAHRPHEAVPVPAPVVAEEKKPEASAPAPAPFVPMDAPLAKAAPPRVNRAEPSHRPAKQHHAASPIHPGLAKPAASAAESAFTAESAPPGPSAPPAPLAAGTPSAAPPEAPPAAPAQTASSVPTAPPVESAPVAQTAPLAPISAPEPPPKDAAPAVLPISTPAATEPEMLKSLWQPGLIQGVLKHRVAIKTCVEKQHAERPEETGVLVMQWVVTAKGATKDVAPKRVNDASAPFASCLAREISTWTFKLSGAPSDEPVQYPFRY